MIQFVLGDFVDVIFLARGQIRDQRGGGYDDNGGSGANVGGGEAGSRSGVQVELCFEVLEVESKVQVISVREGCNGGGGGGGSRRTRAASTARHHGHCRRRSGTGEEISPREGLIDKAD